MHGNKILGANGAFFWACEEQCIQSYDTLKKNLICYPIDSSFSWFISLMNKAVVHSTNSRGVKGICS